jgi:ketosteroid isomerase-like protein
VRRAGSTVGVGRRYCRRMSGRNVDVVRYPVRVRPRSRRTLDRKLVLRFPGAAVVSSGLIARLPPRSRVRQAALRRDVGLSLEAYNRRDLDAVVASWDPQFEYRPDDGWVQAGLVEPSYRGLDGYQRYIAAAAEVWGTENYLSRAELIDLGDRVVVLAEGWMRGQRSGVSLIQPYALVSTLRYGRPVRHQEYFDHAKALLAVGLSE